MRGLIIPFLVVAAAATLAGDAEAQFEAGAIGTAPFGGFAIDGNFGVAFGGLMTYAISDQMAVGPVIEFSTAGRKFELGQQNLKTDSSNSFIFGGR
jgi:hypothetical protein